MAGLLYKVRVLLLEVQLFTINFNSKQGYYSHGSKLDGVVRGYGLILKSIAIRCQPVKPGRSAFVKYTINEAFKDLQA